MRSTVAAYAREFETLVTRAARVGELDPWELLDTYARLEPGGHPHLSDARRLDLEAILAAIDSLPDGFIASPGVRVVQRIGCYTHTPVPSPVMPAGLMEDGALLVEVGYGNLALINLASPVCLLAHEIAKARGLLADVAAESSMAEVAFALGLDEAQFIPSLEVAGEALLELLRGERELPQVLIHVDLDPEAAAQSSIGAANRIIGALAEMGLAGRPLHLWIGDGIITDCLSPYARELRAVLLEWAKNNPELLGESFEPFPDLAGEDLLYAFSHDFMKSHEGLVQERATADRTVGILRYEPETVPFEIIDLGRVDASLCDARLPAWELDAPAPVLLRVAADLEDDEAVGLATLLDALGEQIASVTVLLNGTTLSGDAGTLLLPSFMVQWSGEEKLILPGADRFDPEELVGLMDGAVQCGSILSVSSASLLSPVHVGDLARDYDVRAIEVGGVGIVRALADACFRGVLRADVQLAWALVSSQRVATGRLSLPSITAAATVAVGTLRRITGRTERPVEPEPVEATEPRQPSARAVYIKA